MTAVSCYLLCGSKRAELWILHFCTNYSIGELRATGKEGEEPSQSKTKDTPVSSPTKPWFQREGNLGAQAERLVAD